VGLTDIHYNADSETYQVSIKIFTDDLEKGLEEFSGMSLDIVDSDFSETTDSLIANYMARHFQITSTSTLNLDYIGSEKEYDVTWIYLESNRTKIQEYLHVTNEILMSTYSDQTHILHLTVDDNIQSELIHSEKTTVDFN